MEKYGVRIIGYGNKKRFVPVKLGKYGAVDPLGFIFKTEEEAVNYLNVNGHTCSAIGEYWEILNN